MRDKALDQYKCRIIRMRNFHPVVRVVDGDPLPAPNREVLKKLIEKVALRKLMQMHYEAERKTS